MKNPAYTAFLLLLVFVVSWASLIAYNQSTNGQLTEVTAEPLELGESSIGKQLYPTMPAAYAEQGKKVYVSMGCASCHTQQVRVLGMGSDHKRGWGRVSVPRDYINERWVALGNRRAGPDLRNIGERQKDANWLHLKIYKAASVTESATMPNYAFLYKYQKIDGQPSANALRFETTKYAPSEGYEVVPTEEAEQLVAYLQSLKLDYTLPEVPLQYLVNDK